MVEAALAKYAGAEAEATRLAKEREEAEKAEAERIKREGQVTFHVLTTCPISSH